MLLNCFLDAKVFVTGHTGFKGAWLCEWLIKLGSHVRGFSLAPPTNPNLFTELDLANRLEDIRGDIRDLESLRSSLVSFQPQFVFHLAAQPLVRLSYHNPLETYSTNVLGTIHLLESLRSISHPCSAIIVTTDKCYENQEWVYGYRENDPMGGFDPYSSSKGMAELAINAYRRSFFAESPVAIASVRAGNVIGGGDWAKDRIIPDCIRFLENNQAIEVRNPIARRPWQHVLDPLFGYLTLASHLTQLSLQPNQSTIASAFNFGPEGSSNRTVRELVETLLRYIAGSWNDISNSTPLHEATFLHLSIDKARQLLGWQPTLDFHTAVKMTAEWYEARRKGVNVADLTRSQIEFFENTL
jgi:CDP-glucose 4,6-dehydratase